MLLSRTRRLCRVYFVIATPLFEGADHDTVTCALPPTTVGGAGLLGAPTGVTLADSEENTLVPASFVADTLK